MMFSRRKIYDLHVVFGQQFDSEIQNCSTKNRDLVVSGFPSFDWSKEPEADSAVGVLSFQVRLTVR